jgi:hypothetical protein
MLIECNYCGAPLDVRPDQRLTKCKYCDTTSQVLATRTVAPETPPGWQPPRTWTPPAHVPADSAKTLVYHAAKTTRKIVGVVIAVAVLGAVLPSVGWFATAMIGAFVSQNGKSSAPGSDVGSALEAAERAMSEAKQRAESMGQAAASAENLFQGQAATNLVSKFAERLGTRSVRATELVLYPQYAFLEAQNPSQPKHVDRYMYRNGAIGDPEPVNVQSMRGKLEDNLVALDQVRLDKIPELVTNTLTQLAYENAKVSHIIIERNLPFSKHVVIRVYASGPRESGRIDYTGDGKVLRTYK